MNRLLAVFRHFDVPLLIVSGLLLMVGLVVIYSTSVSAGNLTVFYRQLTFAGIGLIAFLLFSFYNYQTLAKQNRLAYIVIILFLLGLLIFGSEVRGSARWINLGFFQLPAGRIRQDSNRFGTESVAIFETRSNKFLGQHYNYTDVCLDTGGLDCFGARSRVIYNRDEYLARSFDH
jgi:hypothetical protein